MTNTDELPLPEIALRPAFLYAHGNETQLVMVRSLNVPIEADPDHDPDDDRFVVRPCGRRVDRWFCPVFDHIERFGLVLMDRQTHPDTSMMGHRAEWSWYVHPQLRIGFLANGLDTLPEAED